MAGCNSDRKNRKHLWWYSEERECARCDGVTRHSVSVKMSLNKKGKLKGRLSVYRIPSCQECMRESRNARRRNNYAGCFHEDRECAVHGLVPHNVLKGSRQGGGGLYDYSKQCKVCLSEKAEGVKRRLVDLFGGGCQACGYNRCLGAIEFHHVDHREKSFELSYNRLISRPWEKLVIEARKCVCLCATHHREVHARVLKVDPAWRIGQ